MAPRGRHHAAGDRRRGRAAPRGATLSKAAWERTLRVNGEARSLPWSDDVVGMARAAGPAVLVLLVLTIACFRRGRPAPVREARTPTDGA
jgi:hypothetical protein